ncbi:sensor histidine kinase [Actinomadura barringtoniae]|uniref:Oxygen sensor histidine kinase NreB n=1 Tax=Actinomadura barringtoniae TaxID=1427535 RepID=A0A939PQR9_9ACTN|nr:sensor histidine kinase [Actinomadura barringtoniae]MBO2453016.1 sensor histidine kinase [Actinomadura barringtoniae]
MTDRSPAAARSENVWNRSYPFWDAYFGIVLVASVAAMAQDDDSPWSRASAIALLLALTVAYVAIGRRAVRAEGLGARAGLVYAAVAIALFLPAVLLESTSAIALSALVPQMFMVLSTVQATAVLAVLLSGPGAEYLLRSGSDPVFVALAMVIVIASAALLGTFIGRLGVQNRERARLIEELDRTRDELAEVSREAGALSERERLAGDIHDTLAQGFTSIGMLLEAARPATGANHHLDLAARVAQDNLAETRALIAALAPPVLAGVSLEEALGRLAKGFDLPAELTVHGEARPMETAAEVVVLRVAQEGLANVRKHAQATSVRLTLTYEAESVGLTLTDDGCGFDPARATDGYGLNGMRNRVAQIGGTVGVDSAAGAGTTVALEVPVEVPCSES